MTFLNSTLHQSTSPKYTTLDQISTKIAVIRTQPHLGVKADDFHRNLISFFQDKYSTSGPGVLVSWRHVLVDHQKHAIVGIDSHSVVIVVRSFVEVHLSIDIVTPIERYGQFSRNILKPVNNMAFGVTKVPRSDYCKNP